MTSVKPTLPTLPAGTEPHVAALAGRLLERVHRSLPAQAWGGLRTVHLRLLSCVPSSGVTITALAEPLFMTKQAVGQFVTQLEENGHIEVRTDPTDR